MDASDEQRQGAHSCQVDRLYERSRQARDNAQEVASAVRDVVADVESTVREQLEHHPYTVLSTAFGVGYVLGGGLPSRATRSIFDIGTRLAIARVLQGLTREAASANGHGAEHGCAGASEH